MITIKLKGGLGNQMFQYAFGKTLAMKNNTTLKLDLSYLMDRTTKKYFQFRDFELDIFNIDAQIAESEKQKAESRNYYQESNRLLIEPHFHFYPVALTYPDNTYLDGYWQSEKYFAEHQDKIRMDFSFKNPLPESAKFYADKIINSNSICLHVRYGFLNNLKDRLYHGFVGINYINNAIEFIKNKITNPEIFIFSDNHDWCIKNIKTNIPIHFVENEIRLENKDYFQLMSLCRHFIIANSSFSWWAAWLSQNSDKIVIAPKRWFRFSLNNTKDLLPVKWIKL